MAFGGFSGSLVCDLETLGESIHYPSLRTCRLGEQRRHLADELSHYVHTQMVVHRACLMRVWYANG